MTITFQLFLLILVRLASFIWISPGFSNKQIPIIIKLAVSVGLSLVVIVTIDIPGESLSLGLFTALIVKETLLGMTIGYTVQLFFSAVEMAGSFVDFQVGFSMSMVYDPTLGVNASYYGQIYYWIALIIFFLGDIHHHVIRLLITSFQEMPLIHMEVSYLGTEGLLTLFSYVFELALKLAFPMIAIALLADITLAILSRTVPQINVLILGMPLKVLLSLGFMILFLPNFYTKIEALFPQMLEALQSFIYSIGLG